MSRTVILVITTFILFAFVVPYFSHDTPQSNGSLLAADLAQYSSHEPITIANDTDFQNQASLEGWSGNGSSIAPYIIEDYTIETDSDCIAIRSTSVHFKIIDCLLGSYTSNTGKGVSLWNVQNAHIENCFVSWKEYGVAASYGVKLTLQNNHLDEISGAGIQINYVDESIVSENLISSCGYGIDMSYGLSSTLVSNTVYGCSNIAVFLTHIENCTFSGNSVTDNNMGGVSLTDVDFGVVAHNSLANDGLGQSSQYAMGLRVKDSQFIDIESNNISLNYAEGIDLDHSPNCTVHNNILQNNGWGILTYWSSDSSISSNDILDSERTGLFVSDSNGVLVTNNIVRRNGISEDQEAPGLKLSVAQRCEVYDNKLYDNGEYGIELEHSSDCLIYRNEIGWNLAGNSYECYSYSSNIWFHPLFEDGNYWSDYNGTGEYLVGGDEDSIDYFPGMLLQVNDVPDITPEEFMENFTITWSVYALHPGTYEILCMGETVASDSLHGTTITYEANELVSGSNLLKIIVRDVWGHEASDTVVILNPFSSQDMLPLQIISVISVVLVGLYLGYWFLERRNG